jgi:anti-sigma factor RsiW
MVTGHAHVRGLLAAHALDALEEPETTEVEAHVAGCEACRDELRGLHEAATSGLLLDADPPRAGWSRVAAALRRRSDDEARDHGGAQAPKHREATASAG